MIGQPLFLTPEQRLFYWINSENSFLEELVKVWKKLNKAPIPTAPTPSEKPIWLPLHTCIIVQIGRIRNQNGESSFPYGLRSAGFRSFRRFISFTIPWKRR